MDSTEQKEKKIEEKKEMQIEMDMEKCKSEEVVGWLFSPQATTVKLLLSFPLLLLLLFCLL